MGIYLKQHRMKILYTCFKGKNNSSYQLLAGISGDKLCLTNSYEGLKRDIISTSGTYDLVVMFGLDKSLKNGIRVETAAEYDGCRKTTEIDAVKIKEFLEEKGVKCTISHVPTKYLCNAAYWHMLHKVDGRAVFFHIPSLKNMSEEMMEKVVDCMESIDLI